jgi:polynucleotide 5'-kinase involved in rRNA processing
MQYLTGLNEKNKPAIRRVAKKSAKKIVTAYYQAISQQHKKELRQTTKKDKENKVVAVVGPVEFGKQTNLRAC